MNIAAKLLPTKELNGKKLIDGNRMEELARRSRDKNIFVYTDFLSAQEQAELKAIYPKFLTFWGGAEFAERKIGCFGNADRIAVEKDFPLCAVKIVASAGKFASPMSHRDVLGALMSLGIVRAKVGDIFVGESCCCAVLHKSIAPFVMQNLTDVGRNIVSLAIVDAVDQSIAPKRELHRISAVSDRLDAVVCKVFNLSREKACEFVSAQKIFVNGVVVEKASRQLKQGDAVSVRGYGKFVFLGADGTGKKGKTYFKTEIFL